MDKQQSSEKLLNRMKGNNKKNNVNVNRDFITKSEHGERKKVNIQGNKMLDLYNF